MLACVTLSVLVNCIGFLFNLERGYLELLVSLKLLMNLDINLLFMRKLLGTGRPMSVVVQ